jgi:hypothetical protein
MGVNHLIEKQTYAYKSVLHTSEASLKLYEGTADAPLIHT